MQRALPVASVVLFLYIFASLISSVVFSHLVFDEAYNLQVPLHVAHHFSYATFEKPFDEYISTGWTVLLPAALLINAAWWAPRLVVVTYTLLLFFFVARSMHVDTHRFFVFMLFFILIPLSTFFSTHVLGELPAFFWIFASYLCIEKKHYVYAGICSGLAVITKTIAVFAIVPVIIYFIFQLIRYRQKDVLFPLRYCIGCMVPITFGELFRLVFLGSAHNYVENIRALAFYIHMQSHMHPHVLQARLGSISTIFGIQYALIIGVVISAYSGALRFGKVTGKLIALFGLVYGSYYFLLSSNDFYRPSLWIFLCAAVCLPYWVGNRNGTIVIVSCVLLITIGCIKAQNTYRNPKFLIHNSIFIGANTLDRFHRDSVLTAQFETVYFLAHKELTGISGIGWHNSPELSYLLNTRIARNPFLPHVCYIVTGYIDPFEDMKSLKKISVVVFQNALYTVYMKKGC